MQIAESIASCRRRATAAAGHDNRQQRRSGAARSDAARGHGGTRQFRRVERWQSEAKSRLGSSMFAVRPPTAAAAHTTTATPHVASLSAAASPDAPESEKTHAPPPPSTAAPQKSTTADEPKRESTSATPRAAATSHCALCECLRRLAGEIERLHLHLTLSSNGVTVAGDRECRRGAAVGVATNFIVAEARGNANEELSDTLLQLTDAIANDGELAKSTKWASARLLTLNDILTINRCF